MFFVVYFCLFTRPLRFQYFFFFFIRCFFSGVEFFKIIFTLFFFFCVPTAVGFTVRSRRSRKRPTKTDRKTRLPVRTPAAAQNRRVSPASLGEGTARVFSRRPRRRASARTHFNRPVTRYRCAPCSSRLTRRTRTFRTGAAAAAAVRLKRERKPPEGHRRHT